jgi:hypothetical protein
MRAVIPGPLAYSPAYHSPGYSVSTTAFGRASHRQSAEDRYGPFATPMNRAGWMALGAALVYHSETKNKHLTLDQRTDADLARLAFGVFGVGLILFT